MMAKWEVLVEFPAIEVTFNGEKRPTKKEAIEKAKKKIRQSDIDVNWDYWEDE